MERKMTCLEVKLSDEAEGIFEGYASTFAKFPDTYGDIVDKGAFAKTIKENKNNRIKITWAHFSDEVIGIPIELREDDTGLYIKAKLSLGVQRAREALALMKDGAITSMSIGFRTITEVIVDDVRHLKEVKLYEIALVAFPANEGAVILDVRAAERAIANNDIESVAQAVESLHALLKKRNGAEPVDATPEPEADAGAAELSAVLATIDAEMSGFDAVEAERLLESAIARAGG
jgi:hypothetical protein